MIDATRNLPAGQAGVPAHPFPDRSSFEDAALSFTGHGHRLASLYRVASKAPNSFIGLKICKNRRFVAGGASAYLETNEGGGARHV